MPSLYLLVLLSLLPHLSHAQKQLDSLLRVLPTQPDTAKTLTYAELCWLAGQTDLSQAQKWGQTGIDLARKVKFGRGEFENLRSLGASFGRRANYPTALAYFLQALPIAEKMADGLALARVSKNIGMIYAAQKEYTKSLPYYQRTLALYAQQGDSYRLADAQYTVAEVYIRLKRYAEGTALIRRCLAIYKAKNKPLEYGLALSEYAWAFTMQDRYAQAIPYYKQALDIFNREQYPYGIGNVQNGLAESYVETGDYRQAEQYGKQALATLKPTGIWNEIKQAEKHLFRIYTALGDPRQAKQHFEAFEAAQDSVYGQQKGQAVAELQTRFETKLKDQQIAGLTQESRLQSQLRNVALVGAGLLLVVLGLLYNRYQLQLKEKKALAQQRQAEQQLSQSQQEKLQLELDLKHRELASNALLAYQKNEMLGELKQKVDELLTESEKTQKQKISGIQKFIQSNLHFEEDWDSFTVPFEQVHPRFFDKLQTHFPDLTPNEQKLCAYTRINLSNKEIARLLNINTSSVEMSRYRLKKKMSLEPTTSLTDFIQKF